MCLIISLEAQRDDRDRLVAAADLASRNGLRVDVAHPSRWPWARERPVLAKLTEDGGCSCSLLADDADWNAATWHLRSEVVPAVLATLQAVLLNGPAVLRISALWAGDKPERIEHLDVEAFLSRVDAVGLGTKTTYVVTTAVHPYHS